MEDRRFKFNHSLLLCPPPHHEYSTLLSQQSKTTPFFGGIILLNNFLGLTHIVVTLIMPIGIVMECPILLFIYQINLILSFKRRCIFSRSIFWQDLIAPHSTRRCFHIVTTTMQSHTGIIRRSRSTIKARQRCWRNSNTSQDPLSVVHKTHFSP